MSHQAPKQSEGVTGVTPENSNQKVLWVYLVKMEVETFCSFCSQTVFVDSLPKAWCLPWVTR